MVGWEWDFGDGATSDLQNPVHSYASGGPFTVTLTVTDDNGGISSTSQFITILNAPSAAFTVGKDMNVASLGDGASIIDYSSVYGTQINYRPENAIDGSTSSQWITGNGQPTDQWIKVALTGDTTHVIDRVILRGYTSDASIRDFQIRVSNDGTDDANFTTVFSGTLPQVIANYEFTFAPVTARYVQLYIVDNL